MSDFYIEHLGRSPRASVDPPLSVPAGQPTWARVRHGAGCALPRRMKDGTIGVLPVSVPIRLVWSHYDEQRGVDVWVVPADAWSPGDQVEIGPIPNDDNVIVEYQMPHSWAAEAVVV